MNDKNVVKLITDISNLMVAAKCKLGDAMFILPRITIEVIEQQIVSMENRKCAYIECANMFLAKLKETEE